MEYSALLVEDSMSLGALYTEYLRAEGINVTHVHYGEDALRELVKWQPDLLILDIKLPDISGLDILKQVYGKYPNISTIMITAHGSIDIAIDAMRSGAFDFLVKPFDSKRLSITVRNALKQKHLLELVTQYEKSLPKGRYQGFIGDSLVMQSVYKTIDCVAKVKLLYLLRAKVVQVKKFVRKQYIKREIVQISRLSLLIVLLFPRN